ncbi:MAG: VWA domain-containing protein [Planctomycetes bacterium]|nr:VWA domain-containing protein [Planctomycetota bacterium]
MATPFRSLFLLASLGAAASAQSAPQWIVGGHTVLAPSGVMPVTVAGAVAHVRILDRAATTTLEIELHNPAPVPQEAVLLLPVPDGAAVSGFTFAGPLPEARAEVLPRDAARRLYDDITRRLRDPALLEFVDWRCLRSSVFPVPAHGSQRLRVVYDHVLEVDGARADYVLPRSEALVHAVPWQITVDLQVGGRLALCYSPSHELEIVRRGEQALTARLAPHGRCEPGAFRLAFTTEADPLRPSATLFAYPDPTVGGGYFLLLAGAPAPERTAPLRREVTLVLDRSGSMAGRKLEQAKAAAHQVLAGLGDGEGIQVLDYGNTVAAAFPQPVPKDARTLAAALAYVDAIRPHGGTNLHDALVEALRAPALPGTLPLVLFLTDGLPTVGPVRETDLRRVVAAGNPHARRVFCFGVGHDVNVPLLDRIAEATRATTVYVQPDEDVERAVARTFARLDRPVLAAPKLTAGGPSVRIAEVLPAVLPDLFVGDQLVVLGQYRGDADLHFELEGGGADGPRRFEFTLPVHTASTRHAFVPRLWATRQIGFLVDALRQQAGDLGGPPVLASADPFADPRLRELRDEILRLSARFGVLGEYTAFLAREGSDLGDWSALTAACGGVLHQRAVATRSGIGAVNQGCNLWLQKGQQRVDHWNRWLDDKLQRVETAAVQQICDRAFFRRGERWIDGVTVANGRLAPDERVAFGSARFFALLERLQAQGRGGVLSLRGEILLEVDGKNVLVAASASETETEEVIR